MIDMNTKSPFSLRLYFSYSQFMVYDVSVRFPGCAWTKEHMAQGFARRESTVNFSTPLEFGSADVTISGDYGQRAEYDRVIAVPFLVTSGKVVVAGPEEWEVERSFAMSPGNYRLVAAQVVTGDEQETIDLSFEPLAQPLERSSVLVADAALRPPSPLIETAGIAGEGP
jgi:Competence protein J (ComJ)